MYRAKILIPLLGLFLSACFVQVVKHDPEKAVSAANVFLKALYIERNFDHALMLSDQQLSKTVTARDLAELPKRIDECCGSLEELRAESYLMTQGKTMEIFYVGRYEHRTLYHRVVLAGDVSTGYRTSGIWFRDSPYPESNLRRRFQRNIVVR